MVKIRFFRLIAVTVKIAATRPLMKLNMVIQSEYQRMWKPFHFQDRCKKLHHAVLKSDLSSKLRKLNMV
jgi:hypothetical protein